MIQCMDSEKMHRRLNRIMGQLKAIDKMIDQDVPCEDILIQINAAKSALHKAGQVVLEGHLHNCVLDGLKNGDADETISRFAKAIEHFSRMS
ncbi:MAG: metal-sensing transcriptional repressor [Phascolarctobacterium sp.]|nr:metal-sensing transcriptional repressor [Phascolarctobacterium sp.]